MVAKGAFPLVRLATGQEDDVGSYYVILVGVELVYTLLFYIRIFRMKWAKKLRILPS